MRRVRCRLGAMMILVAGLAILCAGAVKWTRYARLRDQIAPHARWEDLVMQRDRDESRILGRCGNGRRTLQAYLAVADEQRRLREDCERQLRRLW